MDKKSISAYDLSARVASYDLDMEIMHPNRTKMMDIALEVLPFDSDTAITAVDLGVGTGLFSKKFIEKYPKSKIIAIDGAKLMSELARVRLGEYADSVDFRIGDFRLLKEIIGRVKVQVVFSSYALHHLDCDEKKNVIKQIFSILLPQGWFINADLIVADSPEIEEIIQKIRVDGIIERAKDSDKRFKDFISTRKFLDELERKEGDKPMTLTEDLQILKQAGFIKTAVFWLEYREAVYGCIK